MNDWFKENYESIWYDDINSNKRRYYDSSLKAIMTNAELMDQLMTITKPKLETIEERVIAIVKGGFEKKFGITIEEFQTVYDRLVEESPDKLI